MTGYTPSEILDQGLDILFGDNTQQDTLEKARKSLSSGNSFFGEIVNIRKDGSDQDVEWHIAPIANEDGDVIYWISIQRDITRRKDLEMQVHAAQIRLLQAARFSAIGELASSIAHRINNPLTTVLGEAQMLKRSLEPDTEALEAAQAIEGAGWRAANVVQQLMDLSSPIESGAGEFDISKTIESAIEFVGSTIERKGVAIELSGAQELPSVFGKEHHLLDAFINLLLASRDSAIEYENPVITITAHGDETKVNVKITFPSRIVAGRLRAERTEGLSIGFELGKELVQQCGGELTIGTEENRIVLSIDIPSMQEAETTN